ncbi:hypothetical protein GCM10022402_11830 [Salinactinospora qingdaonensis]|uniref:Uncharacterized protein n=1 Tax=Salinactinospora qingdaonensis TaxID=702744 RepID=A0ABP7F999_9ACTN
MVKIRGDLMREDTTGGIDPARPASSLFARPLLKQPAEWPFTGMTIPHFRHGTSTGTPP